MVIIGQRHGLEEEDFEVRGQALLDQGGEVRVRGAGVGV